ncbi:MAG TPA: hypothetical protein VH593_22030 [Ktedonobacteraceae bacterium]
MQKTIQRICLIAIPLIIISIAITLGSYLMKSSTNQATPTVTPSTVKGTTTPVGQQATGTPSNPTTVPSTVTVTTPTVVTSDAVFHAFLGTWYVHTSEMDIYSAYTGVQRWPTNPCTPGTQVCMGQASVTFTVNSSAQTITGTINQVKYVGYNNVPAPANYQPDAGDPQVGAQFTLQAEDAYRLLGLAYVGNSVGSSGNHNWCTGNAPQTDRQYCGA